jgi:hypothetical protein
MALLSRVKFGMLLCSLKYYLVVHTCNPSYFGGRDKEDRSSKPAWANSSCDPILKNSSATNKGWWSDSGVREPA